MAFEVSGITVIDGTRNITANTIIASGITYPTSDGTSGQVLITDGSGNLSFSTVSIDGSSYQTKADALAANNTLVALIDDRMQVANVSTLVSTEVSALVDSAPSTLDTLNELAAALGDDPNFATTVTNSIATKLPLAGGTMTGTIAGFTSTGIDDNATSTAITIDSSENVGIGTTSPTDKLHVYSGASGGSAHSYSQLVVENNTHNAIQLLSPDSTEQALWFGDASSSTAGGVTYYHPDNIMTFRTSGTEAARIDSSGNVGIGTTSPSDTLSVNGAVFSSDKYRLQRSTGSLALNVMEYWNGSGSPLSGNKGDILAIGNQGGDGLALVNGGTERMRIDSSGNVGIGTTSPSQLLNVAGNADVNGDFYVGSSDNIIYESGTTFNVRAATANLTFQTNGANERMRIDSSGRVGIGTTSPDSPLHVHKGSAGSVQAHSASVLTLENSSTAILQFLTPDDAAQQIRFGDVSDEGAGIIQYDHAASTMQFNVNGPERMRIDGAGRVGIGTTNLIEKFQIASGAGTGAGIELAGNGTTVGSGSMAFAHGSGSEGYVWNRSNSSILFGTNNTERMRLDLTGKLGLGTSSPANSIDISQGATSRVRATDGTRSLYSGVWSSQPRVESYGGSLQIEAGGAYDITFDTNSTERVRIDSSGDLLVGKSSGGVTAAAGVTIQPQGNGGASPFVSSSSDASVNSHITWAAYSRGASAYRFYVGYGGQIYATSTSISAISDESLKENIRDLDKGLETINALQPRRFDWKNGDGNDIMGFVAQEVEGVLPELVHDYKYSEEETKLGLKMGDMIPSMVKAIQELSAQVTELKAEVAALKGE